MNDAQKAALAALVGITPETHRWLAKKDYVYPNGCGHGNPRHLVGVRLDVSKLPDPLGPDADGVWLVPAVHWGSDLTTPHCYFASVEFAPQMGGGWHCHVDAYGPLPSGEREHEAFSDSMTAAYLQACLVARVPEIVQIMETKS